ncbi:MAG: DUF1707 SHOCT-like domain-containing protein [Frankia sp.]
MTHTGSGHPQVVNQRELRASDADREAVVKLLQRAVGEGRITVAEFEERTRAAFAAKTYADLDVLTTDLPRSTW